MYYLLRYINIYLIFIVVEYCSGVATLAKLYLILVFSIHSCKVCSLIYTFNIRSCKVYL